MLNLISQIIGYTSYNEDVFRIRKLQLNEVINKPFNLVINREGLKVIGHISEILATDNHHYVNLRYRAKNPRTRYNRWRKRGSYSDDTLNDKDMIEIVAQHYDEHIQYVVDWSFKEISFYSYDLRYILQIFDIWCGIEIHLKYRDINNGVIYMQLYITIYTRYSIIYFNKIFV